MEKKNGTKTLQDLISRHYNGRQFNKYKFKVMHKGKII